MSEPVPISLISEYVFCSRSAWLSYAAGAFQPNEFTVEGELLHHRVHSQGTDKRQSRRQWRKVPLYSRRLGLIGYADVVEEMEGVYYPVEHKRGKLRQRTSEQVQLCAQALCLEEMVRRPVETGYIYYPGPRRRLEVPITPELRRLTRRALHEVRELIKSPLPPPAEPSPRCRGCAQADACLSGENALLRKFDWMEWER